MTQSLSKHQYSIACFQCKTTAFLVSGYCENCYPSYHLVFQSRMDETGKIEDKYKSETGKTSFQDWQSFEAWCDKKDIRITD